MINPETTEIKIMIIHLGMPPVSHKLKLKDLVQHRFKMLTPSDYDLLILHTKLIPADKEENKNGEKIST